jgi:hypothetical protein
MEHQTLDFAEALVAGPGSFPGPFKARALGDWVRAEGIADALCAAGFRVLVDRFGTGNGWHTGHVAGSGVNHIEVTHAPR